MNKLRWRFFGLNFKANGNHARYAKERMTRVMKMVASKKMHQNADIVAINTLHGETTKGG